MRLLVETGPLAGTVVPLERDVPTLIGSGDDCALRLREAGVEDQHAVVKALKGKGFGIKALGRVKVNGSEVQASPLADGDVIEIGTTRIAYGDVQESGLPTIPGYRVLGVLGKGGMGTVYRAEQVSLHREVALKVLHRDQTEDPEFVARFIAEARAAAKLQHPNVVSVFDVEHDGDLYYYAMELMHDGSCEDLLKRQGKMPVDRALQVIADAAAGLAYAESLGIVHRDIKPDNLMLDQHGAIKIADLGLASTSGDGGGERAIGTPHFMAPEQVLHKELDHRTDLYALGCTFYRLVTGRTPFRGQTVKDILRAQVKDAAEPAAKVDPDVPPEVSAIIERLMAKDPADRYQTANELLEELAVLLQPPPKRGLWIGLAAAAALIAGGAIYWAVTKPKEKEVVKILEKYDDPLTQQFADRIKVLEAEAKQKDATIALLRAQASDLAGEELARALDQVAVDHAGTTAAETAASLAIEVRREVAERRRKEEQRRQRISIHVEQLRRNSQARIKEHDSAGALRALAGTPPPDLADADELRTQVASLRDEILAAGRAHLSALQAPLAAAQAGDDEQRLTQTIDALADGLEPAARWPAELAAERRQAEAALATGREALTALRARHRAGVWQAFHQRLQSTDVRDALQRRDFPALAAAMMAFAEQAGLPEAALRARSLGEIAQLATTFATALEQLCNDAAPRLTVDGATKTVTRWDREQGRLWVRENGRRRREEEIACDTLLVDQWLQLAEQVEVPDNGSRQCFVGLVAIAAHAAAAESYLRRIDAGRDDSGTGEHGYPFGAEAFEQMLATLPNLDTNWAKVLRDELLAGK
ncbi:MAG TPA: FHA domain-containing protein, partial [bacterium]|nr:FHA domain-containing protein [bacterium]